MAYTLMTHPEPVRQPGYSHSRQILRRTGPGPGPPGDHHLRAAGGLALASAGPWSRVLPAARRPHLPSPQTVPDFRKRPTGSAVPGAMAVAKAITVLLSLWTRRRNYPCFVPAP